MIDVTGITRTPIYRNRLFRRLLVRRIAELVSLKGNITDPHIKATAAVLEIVDRELLEMALNYQAGKL